MTAFAGHDITYNDAPAGSALFAETEYGVCYAWTRPDGVCERADYGTAEAAEAALVARVKAFYGAMN